MRSRQWDGYFQYAAAKVILSSWLLLLFMFCKGNALQSNDCLDTSRHVHVEILLKKGTNAHLPTADLKK